MASSVRSGGSDSSKSDQSVLSATGLLGKMSRQNSVRADHKFRTIDDFYEQAHSQIPAVKGLPSFLRSIGHSLGYFMVFVSLGIANTGDAAEIGSMGFLMANEGFRNDVVQEYSGLVASALYFGMLFGGLAAGPFCDKAGRRRILLWGLFLNSSFGMGMAFAQSPAELCACRFIMGLGIGGIVSCLLALTSEHTPPKRRGSYLNFVAAFWTVGSVYVALMAYLLFERFDKSWRIYVLSNSAPSAMAFFLIALFVPESARFLALHGHYTKSAKVANRLAKSMGFTGSPLTVEDVQVHYPSENIPAKLKQGLCASCHHMFVSFCALYNAGTRRNILFVQTMWFTVSFGSGLSLWMTRVFAELPLVENEYLMTLMYALASVPGVLVAGAILDRVPRTTLMTVALSLTSLFVVIMAILTTIGAPAWAIVGSACIFHSCLVLTWSVLSVVSAEIFPTSMRSTALGMCAASGRIAAISCHMVSAPLIEREESFVLLLLASISFFVGFLASIASNLKSQTGAPLRDIEAGISLHKGTRVASIGKPQVYL